MSGPDDTALDPPLELVATDGSPTGGRRAEGPRERLDDALDLDAYAKLWLEMQCARLPGVL